MRRAGPAFAAFALALASAPAAQADAPRFREEGAAAGVVHVYDGPWEHFVGGGVAAFDCDGDRRPDLFMAGGANPARLFVNRSAAGGPLRFEARETGLPERLARGVVGAYPIDLDNDGWRDLAVLRVGPDVILRGGPDCAFAEATRAFGLDGGRAWTTAFAAAWEAGAAWPTLAFGGYVDRTAPGSPWRACHDGLLFRPDADVADGAPRYGPPQALTPGYCALSMLFTDWAGDGALSLRVSNDRQYHIDGAEQLWRVEPGRPARAFTAAEGWRRLSVWGMGVAEADLDGDGRPEYALTSMGDTKLQKLVGDGYGPEYEDVAWDMGATAHRPYAGGDTRPSTGWHAQFEDVDNDGRLDLFVAKGNVEAMPDFAAVDPDNLLMGGFDGRFTEAGEEAGLALPTRGRGAALVDLNMDGMLDVVVVNRAGPASLFRNLGAPRAEDAGFAPLGNWLKIMLRQPGPNRDAVGALVQARIGDEVVTRRVQAGGGHASGRLGWVHLGLGTAPRTELRVRWPDGAWSHVWRLTANGHALIDRGAETARQWLPPAE